MRSSSLLEVVEPLPPKNKERKVGKMFEQKFISVRYEPEKVQKQGRKERTPEDYPTSAGNFSLQKSGIFLRSFISALFSDPSLAEVKL